MPEGTVVCRRCGVSNAAGDQFCGSCGAFLEWEGDPSEAPPIDPIQSPAAVPPPPTASPAWHPAATEATAVGIACPTCGTVNPTQRVFCQSCGTDLRGLGHAADAAATEPAGTRKMPPEKTGGMPFWLPIVVGIGLVAGVAFVLVGIVLRPAGCSGRVLGFGTDSYCLADVGAAQATCNTVKVTYALDGVGASGVLIRAFPTVTGALRDGTPTLTGILEADGPPGSGEVSIGCVASGLTYSIVIDALGDAAGILAAQTVVVP